MTPQEWIKCVREAAEQLENLEFLQEGATHLAAALEEIAERDAEIVGHRDEISLLHAKLSDAEEEIAERDAEIVGHRDEISLLHAKLSDAEEEIARLRADATGEKDV